MCWPHGISRTTFYNWKAKYGGVDVSEARRMKTLEIENARLRKLLADTMSHNAVLKDLWRSPDDAPVAARSGGQGGVNP